MNKTVTINLSGIVFHIDDNAFEALKRYLESLKVHFSGVQGRDEIIADIESRMAEMFSERVNESKNVIVLDDVQHVIGIMGRPEQVAGEDDEQKTPSSAPAVVYTETRKRFFRNPDDKFLGGVCSGISAYFDLDPVWLRLAFVLAVLFGGTGILLYIILWIIMPEANTPTEKLQMRGEQVNVENIRRSVEEEFQGVRQRGEKLAGEIAGPETKARVKSAGQRAGGFIGDVFRVIGKLIVLAVGIFITIISLAALVALTLAIFAGIGAFQFALPHTITAMVVSTSQIWWLTIGGLLAIGIPFTLLLLQGLKMLFKVRLNLRATGVVLAGLWLIGLGICAITGIGIASGFSKSASFNQTGIIPAPSGNSILLKGDSHWVMGDQHDHRYKDISDLLVLGENSDSVVCPLVRLDIEQSEDDSIYMLRRVTSRGSTYDEARRLAGNVDYEYLVADSVITLPNYFILDGREKYRGQHVKLILRIPVGKSVFLHHSLGWMLDDVGNVTDTWDMDMLGHTWLMTSNGLECSDCEPGFEDREHRMEFNGRDITIEPGGVTIEKDGKRIRITGERNSEEIDTVQ